MEWGWVLEGKCPFCPPKPSHVRREPTHPRGGSTACALYVQDNFINIFFPVFIFPAKGLNHKHNTNLNKTLSKPP